jgi:hypothetical protein
VGSSKVNRENEKFYVTIFGVYTHKIIIIIIMKGVLIKKRKEKTIHFLLGGKGEKRKEFEGETHQEIIFLSLSSL